MALRKRTLGKSGIEVTEVGLGLWAAGGSDWGPTDDEEVASAIDTALDLGATFFDTSDVYGSNSHASASSSTTSTRLRTDRAR